MALPVYLDVHVPAGVTQGLRRKAIDALTAQDDGASLMPDEQLLHRATDLGRVLLTQDLDFLGIASRWQTSGRAFAGILFPRRALRSAGWSTTSTCASRASPSMNYEIA